MRLSLPFLTLALLPAIAAAHITFAEPQAAAGSYYVGFLRVTHGCDGSPTRTIRVEIPAGIDVARPQPKPGWTLTIEHGPLSQPARAESGAAIKERVTAISWTGQLSADAFDQFGLMVKLPAMRGPLYFPTTQSCAVGANAWINTPASPEAWHATKMPAPMLIVTDGQAGTPPARDMGDMKMGAH